MSYMRICDKCRGAIFPPNQAVGYAGPICCCGWSGEFRIPYKPVDQEYNKLQSQISVLESRLDFWKNSCDEAHNNWQKDLDKLKEVEAELELVRSQRNASNRRIEELMDEVFNLRKIIDTYEIPRK